MPTGLLVTVLDLVGTFVFALSGGAVALQRRLDVFGVVVLSIAAGLGGGLLRDVMLDATPPLAVGDVRYGATCLVAAVLVSSAGPRNRLVVALEGGRGRLVTVVQVLDAVGLGLFAVVGTSRGLEAGLGVGPAVAMGVLTSVGGGIARDLLAGRTPAVLHREVYALAALAGAAVVAVGQPLGAPTAAVALVGAGLTTLLRLAAMWRDWHAPRPRSAERG